MNNSRWTSATIAVAGLFALILTSGCFPPPSGSISVRAPMPPRASVTVRAPAPAPAVVTSTPVAVGGQVANGIISYPSQRVRYPLNISYPQVVNIYVNGQGLDPTVAIYDAYGNRIGYNDDGGSGLDSQLSSQLMPGSYVIEVAGYGGSTGPFTVTIN